MEQVIYYSVSPKTNEMRDLSSVHWNLYPCSDPRIAILGLQEMFRGTSVIMYAKQQNKFNLFIIGDADAPDGDIYAKEQAERNFERLNTLFGIIESKLRLCTSKEGTWFLQNIIFNILIRMNINDKETLLEGMSFMYDMMPQQRKDKIL